MTARPRKAIGSYKNITCASCGAEVKSGYELDVAITPVEVTPDWFIAYDPDNIEYNCHICSIECMMRYVKEILNNG